MLIIEAILTYFVWNDGYGWYALIPIACALISALFVNAGVSASGGNMQEMMKNKDPKLTTLGFFVDLIVTFALIIMLVAN